MLRRGAEEKARVRLVIEGAVVIVLELRAEGQGPPRRNDPNLILDEGVQHVVGPIGRQELDGRHASGPARGPAVPRAPEEIVA